MTKTVESSFPYCVQSCIRLSPIYEHVRPIDLRFAAYIRGVVAGKLPALRMARVVEILLFVRLGEGE